MSNIYAGKCPLCGKDIQVVHCGFDNWYYCYECDNCGSFFASKYWEFKTEPSKEERIFIDRLRCYLFYHKSHLRPIICTEEEYAKTDTSEFVEFYHLSPSMVDAWYPKSFTEKADLVLLKLHELAEYDGAYISVNDCYEQLFFCSKMTPFGAKVSHDTYVQVDFVCDFLKNSGYVSHDGSLTFQLTAKAYERIYELKKHNTTNKNVFVSMAFNNGTEETREAIRKAIIDSRFSPEFIDEIIHNQQIMPEMFRLIRESRLLILEISEPNFGAYYEAGYALGLGKEVIICCHKDVFDQNEFKCETTGESCKYYARATKPHFDILQKQILVWTDYNDLTKKLTEWIKALMG